MEQLTSLERTMATIHHQIPDRVPVALHNFLVAAQYAACPMYKTLKDGGLLAETQIKFWRDFKHDVIMLENGVIAEAEACGSKAIYPDSQPPSIVEPVLGKDLGKVRELIIPDPYTAFPMNEMLKATHILSTEIGTQVYIMGRADQGPVALAAALRGWDQLILDFMTGEHPDLIHQLLDYCVKVQSRYMLALWDSGAHGTSMGEAGVDIIGPRLFRQFAYPYDKELISSIGSINFPIALHICGDSTKILGEMVATGAQILELDYKTDPSIAKLTMQDKCTFLGPINPELIWAAENPGIVKDTARQALEVLAPGGEFILGAGCALGANTNLANIHALVETANVYGVYKPDGTLKKPRGWRTKN